MAEYETSITAANGVLGFDNFRDEPWTVAANDRVIKGFGFAGSAAAGDAGVDLLVGQYRVLRVFNITTGFPTMDHVLPLDAYVPAGAKISCPVFDAYATNPGNCKIIVEDL